ncbi:hypothetical protein ASZ90_010732 [hydrocarbon metagenome]|uniref:Uncharacterized protein n=1 Tax=hydrocarbon metagenome TaxID=938273 RepID=A0A0W8FF90_9ZZZZ
MIATTAGIGYGTAATRCDPGERGSLPPPNNQRSPSRLSDET